MRTYFSKAHETRNDFLDKRLFWFEMDMGRPAWREEEIHFRLPLRHGEREVKLLAGSGVGRGEFYFG